MRKCLILVALACCFGQASAQDNDTTIDTTDMVRVYVWKPKSEMQADTARSGHRRNFIAFNIGTSLAVGRFGQAGSRSEGDGFAQNGLAAHFEFAGFWNKNAGFGFATGTFANRVDLRRPQSFSPVAVNVPFGRDPEDVIQTFSNVRPWRSHYLFVGPYVSVPLKTLSVDFKCLGGFLLNRFPGFDYRQSIDGSTDPRDNISFTASSNSRISFGYNLGVNVRLRVSEGMQLKMGADYIQANPQTSYEVRDRRTDLGRQNVSVFNLSWGLAWNVGKRKA
ncbi:MAG: hypothetical protein MUD08_03120 [Cytophagales bacterium]|nr:hypothetical protein [Cytophagales bacterium]